MGHAVRDADDLTVDRERAGRGRRSGDDLRAGQKRVGIARQHGAEPRDLGWGRRTRNRIGRKRPRIDQL